MLLSFKANDKAGEVLVGFCHSKLKVSPLNNSSTANVHQTFNSALNNSLSIQDNIYNKMSAKGWYAPEQAEQNKINTVKQKFCCGQAQG